MLGSVFFHPTCYKKQMQIEFALLRGCSRVVIKELYVEERIFIAVLGSVFFFPPETPCVWESEPAADALTVIISRAESCNHLDSFACSIYPSIQDYFCTISVILSFFWVGGQIVQFKHRHSQWGICHWENSRGGLVFMEYSVIRASSNSNIKLQVFFLF